MKIPTNSQGVGQIADSKWADEQVASQLDKLEHDAHCQLLHYRQLRYYCTVSQMGGKISELTSGQYSVFGMNTTSVPTAYYPNRKRRAIHILRQQFIEYPDYILGSVIHLINKCMGYGLEPLIEHQEHGYLLPTFSAWGHTFHNNWSPESVWNTLHLDKQDKILKSVGRLFPRKRESV